MFDFSHIPLARLSLFHSKARLFISVSGVAFAVLLMFVEMGFLNGLFDSQAHLATVFNADLIMMNNSKEATIPLLPFPKSRLIQAKAFAGVTSAYPLYMEMERARWKALPGKRPLASGPSEHKLVVFGFDPEDAVFQIPEVIRLAPLLKEPDTALFDVESKPVYGDVSPGSKAELSHRGIRVVGNFPFGADFRVDGNVLVSDQTFSKLFPNPRTGEETSGNVEFGLLKLSPGTEPAAVQRAMMSSFNDVSILTPQEFQTQIKKFWGEVQPVGIVFGMGMAFGFAIGVSICYQILYTDIFDHIAQYATLKAIGYSNGYVAGVVIVQAIYLTLLGFLPGALCSVGAYRLLHHLSGMIMQITPARIVGIFALTLVMSVVAAIIAIRPALRFDPAEVF